jgi:hypothetical protein
VAVVAAMWRGGSGGGVGGDGGRGGGGVSGGRGQCPLWSPSSPKNVQDHINYFI